MTESGHSDLRNARALSDAAEPDQSSSTTHATDVAADAVVNPAADSAAASLGRVGRFELRRQLGEGGAGTVYLAYDPTLQREVALKVPKFPLADRKSVERFLREARAASRLRHPNVVAVFESGEAETQCYLVFEYIAGESLQTRLNGQPIDCRQAAAWARDLAEALHYAHGDGVVHRDVKPSNILIEWQGRPLLMDFGVARRGDLDVVLTADGSLLGTPAYMSPEQAEGDRETVGPLSDQYSLGVVLYEMLTGQRPFSGSTYAILGQIIAAEPREPRALNKTVPRDLEAVCLKAMAKRPTERYSHAGDFAADLQRWLEGQPVAARPAGTVWRSWRWYQRNQPAVLSTLVLLLAVLLVASWILVGRWQNESVVQLTLVNPSAAVWLDDQPLAPTQITQPHRVRSGRHTLIVRIQGQEVERHELKLLPGETEHITLGIISEPKPRESSVSQGLNMSADAPPPAVAPFDAVQAKQHQTAWAQHLGVPVEFENSIGVRFVLIPPGEFDMGSTEADVGWLLADAKAKRLPDWYIQSLPAESPQHRVRITKPFWLSRHELTRGQFRRFVDERGYQTEAERGGKGGFGLVKGQWVQDSRFVWNAEPGIQQRDDHPVGNVSWNDATAFCQWMSERDGVNCHLPTEAQWEYACRAGTTTSWHGGDTESRLAEEGWFSANARRQSHPVEQLRPNAWGLYDLHGNAGEWCQDWWDQGFYAASPLDDPTGAPAGSARVRRGGGWGCDAPLCRSSYRCWDDPGIRGVNLGFRLVRIVSQDSNRVNSRR